MASETPSPYDVLEDLRGIVADLKRCLYGDAATRSTGLLNEFDSLRRDVNALRQDVEAVKNHGPNVIAWTAGYIAFCAAGVFTIAALMNQIPGHEVMGIPGPIATWLALVLAGAALALFLIGFNWFDRRLR